MDALDRQIQEELKSKGNLPRHVAIIMDGNGRWARKRGLPRVAGHREGIKAVRDTVEACGQLGIDVLTLYAFSKENWNRPRQEIAALMKLLVKTLREQVDELLKNNVKLTAIGSLEDLPVRVREELQRGVERTQKNTGLVLNLALSYSSRREILEAVRKICSETQQGKLLPENVDEELFSRYLYTFDLPDPDLLIRTSGEMRVSNFLLWQLAYTELYVTEVLWPDFRRSDLYQAIEAYQQRERRFGMVSEQIQGRTDLDLL